jgi:hypothetical protein
VTPGITYEDGAAQPQDLEALRDQHREELIQLRGELMRRVISLQESRQDLADRLEEQIAATRALERSLREAQRQMQAMYESRTWRAGTAVRRVFRPISPEPEPHVIAIPDLPPARPAERLSPFVEAPPAVDPHPLAAEYRAEVISPPAADGRGVGFAVSTTNFGEGRGDLFVATGLGRYMRRRGYEASYFPLENWYEASGLEWVIAMLPGFRPSLSEETSKFVGWARNAFDDWLIHPELDKFDVMLTSSPRFAVEAREVFRGEIHLLPIGVDLELFEPSGSVTHEGVVTTTNHWGGERDLFRALRSSSVSYPLHIYGQPAGLSKELHSHYLGPVDYFELPGIYGRARVVLDDSHPAVVGWGAVNSRIYDVIAAGAIPVTNSGDGLEDLGLTEIPTYSEPSELNPLVESLLADGDGVRSRVARLKSVVERRHSYETRAAEFIQILSRSST